MLLNNNMNYRELIAWTLENLPLADFPGSKFAYSNFGYYLLGRIIEKITGSSTPIMSEDQFSHCAE